MWSYKLSVYIFLILFVAGSVCISDNRIIEYVDGVAQQIENLLDPL
jgi:hypothetical protein